MNPEVSGHVLRFVAADCGEADVRHALPQAERVELRPIGLKRIFLALAKEGRRPCDS